MGINVGVSVERGVEVSEGVIVTVSVGMGVNVSVKGMLVDVSSTIGEGEAAGAPLLKLQARVVTIIKSREYLFFIPSLY